MKKTEQPYALIFIKLDEQESEVIYESESVEDIRFGRNLDRCDEINSFVGLLEKRKRYVSESNGKQLYIFN